MYVTNLTFLVWTKRIHSIHPFPKNESKNQKQNRFVQQPTRDLGASLIYWISWSNISSKYSMSVPLEASFPPTYTITWENVLMSYTFIWAVILSILPPEIPFLITLDAIPFGLTEEISESPINRIWFELLLRMVLGAGLGLELDTWGCNVLRGAGRGLCCVSFVRSLGVDVLITSLYCLVCRSGSSEAGLGRLLFDVFGVLASLFCGTSSCATTLVGLHCLLTGSEMVN